MSRYRNGVRRIKASGPKEEDLRDMLNRRHRILSPPAQQPRQVEAEAGGSSFVDRDFRRLSEKRSTSPKSKKNGPERTTKLGLVDRTKRSRDPAERKSRHHSERGFGQRGAFKNRRKGPSAASEGPRQREDSAERRRKSREASEERRKRRKSREDSPAAFGFKRQKRFDSGISSTKEMEARDFSINDMVVLDAVGDSDDDSAKGQSESSLSLSPSPSPERAPMQLPPSRPTSRRSRRSSSSDRRRHSRRPSPLPVRPSIVIERGQRSPKRSRFPMHRGQRRELDVSRNHFRSSELNNGPTSRDSMWRPDLTEASWESKVEAFVQLNEAVIKVDPIAIEKVDKIPEKASLDPPPPGVELNDEELAAEDLKATPLIRYIGKKLVDKKRSSQTPLRLEGVFQFNLLSLLTRAEWVAAKSIQLLEEAGYKEDSLYSLATVQGGPALESELKSAVFKGKVNLGTKPALVLPQVLRVIECIVKYFTSADGDESQEEENKQEEESGKSDVDSKNASNPIRAGVGDLLKQLAVDADEAAKRVEVVPEQPPLNPWTYMWDNIQAQNLKAFADMKNFIAKDLLRIADETLCGQSRAFEVAQDMVSCLVLAGYTLGNLKQLVMQTADEDILPPKDVAIVDKDGIETATAKNKYLYNIILDRLVRMRSELPKLEVEQLEYLVRKCLLYVMRGCDRMPAPVRNSAGFNIVFNYLPPGLRELENKPKSSSNKSMTIEEGETPRQVENIAPEDKESTDPLNAILCPQQIDVSKPNELPNRKYLLGCVHTEWVVLKGKPQIYEISIYMSDMSSLNLYSVPDALQKQPDTMENLGFVANPDRHEFYYVQVGVGCVKTLTLEKAVEKLSQFLEEKRHLTTSENKNNGVILNFYSEEEMSIVLRVIEATGHKNLMLDIVKGFGCLEHFMARNRSKKMVFSGPKLNIGGEDCFYHTEVRKGLQASNLVSKSKGEALYQALEFFLDDSPGFSNYILPNCFPSFSPKTEDIKRRLRQVEEMYHLEVFMAAQLKDQRANLFLEGVFQPQLGKDLRDKATVVASRICRLLVEAGFDKGTLTKCFAKNSEFTINSSVILDKMSISQRLKVTDQTMRCIGIIHRYFQPSQEEEGNERDAI